MVKKLNFEEVEKYFEDNGCKLLETTYQNNVTPMRYRCACGKIRLGGYSNMNTLPIIHPVGTYRKWIDDSGLKIVSEQINEEKVEDFFFNYQNIWNRIHSRWNGDDPTEQLKISSIDYVLTSNTAQVF